MVAELTKPEQPVGRQGRRRQCLTVAVDTATGLIRVAGKDEAQLLKEGQPAFFYVL